MNRIARLTAVAVTVAATAGLAPVASAATHASPNLRSIATKSAVPTPVARRAVTAAILGSPMLGLVRPSNVAVSDIRFSADGRFASATATPKNHMTDPAQVALARRGTQWVVKDLGTMSVGCGIMPQRTRAQLHLDGGC